MYTFSVNVLAPKLLKIKVSGRFLFGVFKQMKDFKNALCILK